MQSSLQTVKNHQSLSASQPPLAHFDKKLFLLIKYFQHSFCECTPTKESKWAQVPYWWCYSSP
jgi:hypothetical protein